MMKRLAPTAIVLALMTGLVVVAGGCTGTGASETPAEREARLVAEASAWSNRLALAGDLRRKDHRGPELRDYCRSIAGTNPRAGGAFYADLWERCRLVGVRIGPEHRDWLQVDTGP